MYACLNARKNLKISSSKTDESYLIKLTFSVYICIFSMNISLIRLKTNKTTSTTCYNCRSVRYGARSGSANSSIDESNKIVDYLISWGPNFVDCGCFAYSLGCNFSRKTIYLIVSFRRGCKFVVKGTNEYHEN